MTSQASAYVGRTPQPFSDDALALRLAAEQKDRLRYVAAWGRWLHWDGARWRFDDTLVAYRPCAPHVPRRGSRCNNRKSPGGGERQDRRRSRAARQGRPSPRRHNRPVGRRPVVAQHAGRHRRSAQRRDAARTSGGVHDQNHGGRAGRRLPRRGSRSCGASPPATTS